MDFFSAQDRARAQTRWLVVLYALAVLALIGISHAVGVGILAWVASEHSRHNLYWNYFFRPDLFLCFTTLIGTIIFIGTMIKMFSLRQGGSVVARELGGRELSRDSTDVLEARLLNIVEEMAIASGAPVPRVFLLNQESGINAFAAGHTLDDAAIGVTRGAIEQLNREQLQGVIAHEFSHILNADMRLNIRLIGVLNGILCVFLLGKTILRIMSEVRPRRSSSRSKDNNNSLGAAFFLAAVALMLIGSVGAFFARMIQAAVSRQREFLADSSAVQFTRNPEGLAGALRTIAKTAAGSTIKHPRASEVGHLFFSDGLSGFLVSLFATHPPLKERVRRLLGRSADFAESAQTISPAEPAAVSRLNATEVPPAPSAPEPLVSSIGTISPPQISQARIVIEQFPAELAHATRDMQGAQCLLAGLMLSSEPHESEHQLPYITSPESPLQADEILKLAPLIRALPVDRRLALLSLSVPTLRKLSPRQYAPFKTLLTSMADADQRLTLPEYLILTILRHSVEPMVFSIPPSNVLISNRTDLTSALSTVLSALAQASSATEEAARSHFSQAQSQMPAWSDIACTATPQLAFAEIDSALDTLSNSSPSLKREVVTACSLVILADKTVGVAELELFRAVCAALGCPVPILKAGTGLSNP